MFGRKVPRMAGVTPHELYAIETPVREAPVEEAVTPPNPRAPPEQPKRRKEPETNKERKHWFYWFADNNVGRVVTATAVAGAITAGVLLSSGGSAKQAADTIPRPVPTAAQNGSSQTTGQTASDIYYSRVRASLLQDVPDLANYQSALDYTAQRMVDMKNVYGLSLDQVRAPITKWVQANIDWDKKGERLIPFAEGPDFIPYTIFRGNFTTDTKANDLAARARQMGTDKIELAALASYVDELISQHDSIWDDLQDPIKLTRYLDAADSGVPLQFTEESAKLYKAAVREHGTINDKRAWALLGRLSYIRGPEGSNEELRRNEQYLFSLMVVGGDGRISENTQLLDTSKYQGSNKIPPLQHDRQTMFRMSGQLKNEIISRPETYGRLLDPDYLAPNTPSAEALERAKGWTYEKTGVKLIEIPYMFAYTGLYGKDVPVKFLIGNPETARKLGDTRF